MTVESTATFPVPPVDQFSYLHICHGSFAFSDGDALVAVDPFFSGRFDWANGVETHLEPPLYPPEQVRPLDAILLSHEHGDHFDAETVGRMLQTSDAPVYAPAATVQCAEKAGLDTTRFTAVSRFMSIQVGGMRITFYPAVESENEEPPGRVGFLFECNGKTLYHQGDSHGPAPSWQRFAAQLDALIIWPVYVDLYVRDLKPAHVIFHHLDRFTPGNFFCNKSADKELDYWRYRYPDTTFSVPERNVWTLE